MTNISGFRLTEKVQWEPIKPNKEKIGPLMEVELKSK